MILIGYCILDKSALGLHGIFGRVILQVPFPQHAPTHLELPLIYQQQDLLFLLALLVNVS